MGSLPGAGQAGLVHRMELPPIAASVAAARNGTRDILESCGLGHLVEEAILLVSELVTNAVRHACGDGSPLELRVGPVRDDPADRDPRQRSASACASRPWRTRRVWLRVCPGRGFR